MAGPVEAYVSIGANIGVPEEQLVEAARRMATHGRVALRGTSSLWLTSPVGPVADQPDFTNAVLHLETRLSPRALLALCQAVEDAMGRDRSDEIPLGPRPIDLDLLTYGDLVLDEEGLTLPHPLMSERAFVLEPLRELNPHFAHPATGRTVEEMLAALPPGQRAEKLGPLVVELR